MEVETNIGNGSQMVAKNLQEKNGEVIKGQETIRQIESNSSRNHIYAVVPKIKKTVNEMGENISKSQRRKEISLQR